MFYIAETDRQAQALTNPTIFWYGKNVEDFGKEEILTEEEQQKQLRELFCID